MHLVHNRLLRQSVLLTLALAFVACSDTTDNPMRPTVQRLYTTPTGLLTANPPQIFIGAGDIASCGNDNDEATAKLLDANPVGTVYNIGDDAYQNGTTSEFANCYDPTWGRHKSRTKPTPGNHEYNTSGAVPYYNYFGAAAGDPSKGYYSFDLGAWHILSLNSNISRSAGSAQDTWLAADLAAHPNRCTLAYFHHPLYSSTGGTGSGGVSLPSMQPYWDRLYAAHADLILNGHRHFYERLAPMKPDGSADPTNGIREIIAGMGGIGGGSLTNVFPTSEVREGRTFGVLKLYLYDDSYAWKFIPVAGKTFTDSGSAACHFSGGGGGGGGGVVSATNSTVSASPTSFTAGSGSSTITVTARDGNGSTMSGANVTLTPSGSGNTLTPSSGTTDGGGVFTSTLTSSVAEVKTVSATINSTPINQTAQVTVNPSGGGGGGTISHSLLTSGSSSTNQKVYTTASISPAANALVTLAVRMRWSGGALTPTVSGGGMTSWTQVGSVDFDPLSGSIARLVVFRAMSASPGSGPITITYSSSIANSDWIVSQWTGVDQSGSNGSGAIGQTGTARGDAVSSLSTTLAAFANSNNVGYGIMGASTGAGAVTPGSGFAEIAEVSSGESELLEAEWATNRNTVQATLSSAKNAGLLAIEIKAAGGGAPTVSASLSTVAASSPITAGSGTSNITVTVKDQNGNAMNNVAVTVSATGNGNTLSAFPNTDVTGVSTGTLTATGAGPHVVTAIAGGVTLGSQPTVTVNAATPDANQSTISAAPSSIQVGATSTLTVTVKDAFGNPVNNSPVVLSTSGTNFTLTQPSNTGPSGVTTGSLTSTDPQVFSVSATAGGTALSQPASVTVTPPVPTVSASLSSVSATSPITAGGATSTITVTVLDQFSNPMNNVAVTVSATGSGNTISAFPNTDGSGVSTGTLSATGAGPHVVTAAAGGTTLDQKPTVTVNAAAPDATLSTISATPPSILVGGTSTLTVTAKDAFGNPVSNQAVALSTSGTNFTLTQPAGNTDLSGVTTGTLTSTDPQVFSVSATAGGTALSQPATVTATNQPPASITHTLLTSGNNAANGHTYTTASIAPAANALVTLAVLTHASPTAAPDPTVSGGGMSSWVVVASLPFGSGTPLSRLTIYRAMSAAPGSGPITIYSSPALGNIQWVVSQWTGVDNSGTDGSGAIAQTGSATGNAVSGLSVALAAFGNSANAAYGVFGIASNAAIASPGSGFTTIAQQPSGESTVDDLFAEWAVNKTPVNATWTSKDGGALAFEIKAGP